MKNYYVVPLVFAALGCSQGSGPTDAETRDDVHRERVDVLEKGESMLNYPSPADWVHATPSQRQRADRSFELMRRKRVPVYHGPLIVDDDVEVVLQSPQDVARRTLVLWAVELRAEGIPLPEARGIISNLDLWDYVSEKEKQFLDQDEPSPDASRTLVWRLESLWVLMWALGYIDELNWPSGMCDVPTLAELVSEVEDDPSFIANAKLRPLSELLDAQDLTMRIHWAVRDAFLHQGGMIPEELDWSGEPEYVPVHLSSAVGVVEERHYVLNWLVNYLSPETWDDVDTPT